MMVSRINKQTGPALGGAGPNWEQFRSAQVPSQLAPRSVQLGAGPNWEQLVQLAYGQPYKQYICVTCVLMIITYCFMSTG